MRTINSKRSTRLRRQDDSCVVMAPWLISAAVLGRGVTGEASICYEIRDGRQSSLYCTSVGFVKNHGKVRCEVA